MKPEVTITNNFRLLGTSRILIEPPDKSMGGGKQGFWSSYLQQS